MLGRSPCRPSRRGLAVLAAIAVIGAGGTGCGGDEDGGGEAPTTQAAATSPTSMASAPTSASASSPPASTAATAGGNQQTSAALQAIATAQREVQGGKLFALEDETEDGQRVWSAKVATPDDRQFDLAIARDGSKVIANDEDSTPDDDLRKLKSAKVTAEEAIDTAVGRASGKGDLTSLEIDSDNNTTVWQVEFGDDDGTTVLVDAASGEVLKVGPDVG